MPQASRRGSRASTRTVLVTGIPELNSGVVGDAQGRIRGPVKNNGLEPSGLVHDRILNDSSQQE